MMRVAVCCKESVKLEKLEKWIGQIKEIVRCDGYTSLSSLIQTLSKQKAEYYQIVVMDLNWDGKLEGIDAARYVWELSPDTRILYMVDEPSRYVQELFLRTPNMLGFLIKPVEEKILLEYIWKIIDEQRAGKSSRLLIRNKGAVHSIPVKEILYLESEGHTVSVRTAEETYSSYGRLDHFLEQLSDSFIQCHKSYAVNMKWIHSIERYQIMLDNGWRVPVSKARYMETQKRYSAYVTRLQYLKEREEPEPKG